MYIPSNIFATHMGQRHRAICSVRYYVKVQNYCSRNSYITVAYTHKSFLEKDFILQ